MNGQSTGSKRAAFLLGALTLLAAVVVVQNDWLSGPREAQAVGNPAEIRQQMLGELQQLNQKMDRLIQLFESGKVKVEVSNADEIGSSAPAPAPAVEKNDEPQNKIIIRRRDE